MFYNFLKIAFRNLWRNKTFSFINLFGLTIGTASCLYILLFVQDHRSYDRHHVEAGDVYRVVTDLQLPNDQDVLEMASLSPPIAPAMQEGFAEVETAARAARNPSITQVLIRQNNQPYFVEQGFQVDSTFFEVLNYHFAEGNPQTALDQPFSLVISQALAQRIFGSKEALGETLQMDMDGEVRDFIVTGVYTEEGGKTHFEPSYFMSMSSGGIGRFVRSSDAWASNNFIYGYVRLKPGADASQLAAKLPAFLEENGGDQLRDLGIGKELHLQPVTSIHTNATRSGDVGGNISSTFLSVLLLIAGFIQLVACINFMNLTTSRSSLRSKEVGVRKAVGASKRALVGQFLGEGILFTLLSMAMAIPLVQFAMPLINSLVGAEVSLDFSLQGDTLLLILGLMIGTGLLAGSYPAFYLSSFQPIGVLRGGKSKNAGSGAWLRKGFVIGQFVLAITLVIGALLIRLQLNYMLDKDLGFDKEQKVVFSFQGSLGTDHLELFRNELIRLPEVSIAAAMSDVPGQQAIFQDLPLYKEGGSMDEATDVLMAYSDGDYFSTLDVELLGGRDFVISDTSSTRGIVNVIVNEKTLEQMSLPLEEAVGTTLYSDFGDNHIEATIVGVMENIICLDLSSEIRPFLLVAESPRYLNFLVADVQTRDYSALLEKAEAIWKGIVPDVPFDYSFLDESIASLYESEQTLSRIISAFTLMAILISCLGLFGLSVFAAEQRTKEIGIRKVLGASTTGILGLLSKDYIKLVLIALVVASPVAYFVMNRWLDEFAFRISIQWWVFVVAGLAAVGVTLLTISFQSIRAALSNPADSLRNE
jgi:putative ABC transport system permease protein